MIAVFKVVFGFLFVCLMGGLFFYTIFDLKPWRRDSQLWDPEKGPGPVFLKYKKNAQQGANSKDQNQNKENVVDADFEEVKEDKKDKDKDKEKRA